jgi:hypothetical protein
MQPTDLSEPLFAAAVATLKADPRIIALVGPRVVDYVSANMQWPFIRVTTAIVTPWEATGDVGGSRIRLQVDGFTKGYGRSAARTMNSNIAMVLNEKPLALSAGYLIYLTWLQSQVLDDPSDQGAYHGIVEFEGLAAA